MSLDTENKLRVLLASAPQNIYSIPTIEISHSSMTKTYLLWKEPYEGIVEIDSVSRVITPLNMDIKLAGTGNNLDQKFNITLDLTDVEDEFREQLDLIPIGTLEKIRIYYREYISNDLTSVEAESALQAESISYGISSCNISAVQPRLSMTRTGEIYSTKDIPMLRGFL